MSVMAAMNRRQFLGTTAALAGTAVLGSSVLAADKDPYGGFKMGLQSYSLRHFKAPEALKHTQTLGLKRFETELPVAQVTVSSPARVELGSNVQQ